MENVDMSSFWADKRVLVTGHTGFKGGWLTHWLASMGASVTGYALLPEKHPNLFALASIEDYTTSVIGDIRDSARLQRCALEARPEIIFHLAAQPLVRRSYVEPALTYETNVMGTVNLLEAARKADSVRVIVNITTDKCYENREHIWSYRETDRLGGHDPYSSSKACAELVSAAYRQSFLEQAGIKLATARAGNVIGGGDWAEDRLLPDCLRALLAGDEIVLRNPASIRPWQHVLEPVGGYLLLAEKLWNFATIPRSYNFGPEEAEVASVQEVVGHLVKAWGGPAQLRLDPSPIVHEAGLLTLDSTLARHTLGWRPQLDLASAVGLTVDWFRAYAAGSGMDQVTLNQIQSYRALLSGEMHETSLQAVSQVS